MEASNLSTGTPSKCIVVLLHPAAYTLIA